MRIKTNTKTIGDNGEKLASEYLSNLGYKILETNWRYKKLEVDIIAEKGDVLHFVEVKSRKHNAHGFPEENVTKTKLKNLVSASEAYLIEQPNWNRIQFDVLAITFAQPVEYFFIEDVFDF